MTHHRHLPYNAERLTDPEQALQNEQQRGNCCTCDLMQRRKRSGAIMCAFDDDHDYTPADVIAGRVVCEDYAPIKEG